MNIRTLAGPLLESNDLSMLKSLRSSWFPFGKRRHPLIFNRLGGLTLKIIVLTYHILTLKITPAASVLRDKDGDYWRQVNVTKQHL